MLCFVVVCVFVLVLVVVFDIGLLFGCVIVDGFGIALMGVFMFVCVCL